MLNKEKDFQIGDISEGSVVNQVGGNIINNYQGLQIEDVKSLVYETVQIELEKLSNKAMEIAIQRLDKFTYYLIDELEAIKEMINRFAEPAMRVATYDAAIGYIKFGDPGQCEALVDLLIERVKVNEHTTKQFIIDEAIRVLSKLSNECIAVLTLMTYYEMIVKSTRANLENWIRCMNPIIDLLPKVNKLDIQYLTQINCISQVFYLVERDLVKKSLNSYPFAFCHPIDAEHSKEFMQKYDICRIEHGLTGKPIFQNDEYSSSTFLILSKIFNYNKDGTITPQLLNMDEYREMLHQTSEFENILQDVESLFANCTMMSDQEVMSYYENFNSNWLLAFNMLKGVILNHHNMQPLGLYIGMRKLYKLSGLELPMEELFKFES